MLAGVTLDPDSGSVHYSAVPHEGWPLLFQLPIVMIIISFFNTPLLTYLDNSNGGLISDGSRVWITKALEIESSYYDKRNKSRVDVADMIKDKWISYVDNPGTEESKVMVNIETFPDMDPASEDTRLWINFRVGNSAILTVSFPVGSPVDWEELIQSVNINDGLTALLQMVMIPLSLQSDFR